MTKFTPNLGFMTGFKKDYFVPKLDNEKKILLLNKICFKSNVIIKCIVAVLNDSIASIDF